MKSIIIIASSAIATLALTAFTYSNWNAPSTNNISCQTTKVIEPPTFSYNLSPGCPNTITKERMHNAKIISDLIPDFRSQENLKNNIISVRDVKIKLEDDNEPHSKRISQKDHGNTLNKKQITLLRSTNYSTNFFLEGYYTDTHSAKDINNDRYFNYCMTVIPEQQATYKDGNKAFIEFLSTQCQTAISKVQKGNLQNGSLSFTITKAGAISDIAINSTCGYPSVDERMKVLIKQLPNTWNAAANSNGEKVNQTLVFSFGQTGC